MTFPIYNLPNGDTFIHRDLNTGKFWTHDNAVWTPKDFTDIDDLFDVFHEDFELLVHNLRAFLLADQLWCFHSELLHLLLYHLIILEFVG